MLNLSYILLGVVTGFASGFLGIGGGFIVIPALIYIFHLSQHQAQGTSLAMMIPPITFFAVLRYYNNGNVKTNIAILLAIGFILGGIIGAEAVQSVNEAILRRIFAIVLLAISIKMLM